MRRKRAKKYFVGVNKADNSVIICSTKAELGRFVGISVYKLSLLIDKMRVVEVGDYILWRQVEITKVNRGWSYR